MKPVLILLGVIAIVGLVVAFVRSRIEPSYQVGVADIPKVLASLSGTSAIPAFAVFIFNTADRPSSDDALSLQFSLDDGRPGFDWVLIGQRNIEDEARFTEFARAAGFRPELMESNNVRYWRVEDSDLALLCREVVTKMYGRADTEPIDLITEGFEWKP